MTARPRLLLIADVPGWIFERHCKTLKHLLSDEFDITIKYSREAFEEAQFDLIYPLEWYMVKPGEIGDTQKYITGIRSHLVWPDIDFSEFVGRLNENFNRVHVVSSRLHKIFSPHVTHLYYVTHGVDTAFFNPLTTAGGQGGPLRIGWAGNRKSLGSKGFEQIIAPLGETEGVELVFCGYSDRNLSMAKMKQFYDSIDVYVCASENFEGNNNPLMEAAAMARAIVTTDNGTVPEYLESGRSALVVDRELEAFRDAVAYFRDHRDQCREFGRAAQEVVRTAWDWKLKAEDYRRFFRSALKAREGR